jgi:prepilin-type N-terminal cleavage/methylation domain-containing protein
MCGDMKGLGNRSANVVIGITARLRRGSRSQAGFTLIELMVVIIIIAVLATIAIPTFMGQRQHAQDAAAYTLVRNALTAVQGAFVDTGDYTLITEADLRAMEPTIDWVMADANLVSTTPAWMTDAVGADAVANQVAFFGQSHDVADLASVSESGNSFGIQVDTKTLNETGYIKVRVIDGSANLGW